MDKPKVVTFPKLRHNVLDNGATKELNDLLDRVKTYVDHSIKNAPISEEAKKGLQSDTISLVNGLVTPLIGSSDVNASLQNIGSPVGEIPVGQIPDLPASIITSGTFPNSRISAQVLRSDLGTVGGPVVANRSITVVDNLGNSVVVPIV